MYPGPGNICIPNPDDNYKNECVTAECAAGLPPANTMSKEDSCYITCSATAGSTCAVTLRGGINPYSAAAYVACRAAVASTCREECNKAYCETK